jgi:dephospho-CoA kinase
MQKQTAPYAIKEAALLFESGSNEGLDCVIGVYAPQQLRIKRVMDRDGVTYEEVMSRLNRQIDEEEKMQRCDFIITNDEAQLLIPQVMEMDRKLRG